ncbi:flavin reductase family protein [Sphingomonas sp.]|uniref:flavin reductase family protein n=1 Tax=Sphingomonas sp. TaxID=28214 RepID=UPI002DD676A8|nr:flavin reductase family protein [Sphingomonas sp.]
MQFDMETLPQKARYKILTACVTPRPIAWVTSRSPAGVVNAAPYSFFNVMGDDPPTVALGILRHEADRVKDTAANIRDTGEFVVNLVTERDGTAMNATCADVPPDRSEIEMAGIQTSASVKIRPPRIASSPAAFECVTSHLIATGKRQFVVIGRIVQAHVDDRYLIDREHHYIDSIAMNLLGRMHGSGWYSRQTDLIAIARSR